MAGKFHHEEIYRGAEVLRRLAATRVVLCGAGALGSHLAENLARHGAARLRVIDRDKVEEHNVSTQVYGVSEVGVWKVEALRNRLFRATGVEVEAVRKELAGRTAASLLSGAELVIDAFDNSASRAAVRAGCRASGTPCVHAGLFEDYGEVVWDEEYRVPADVAGDVCDYPLARDLVLLTVAVATEAVLAFAATGRRGGWSITLRDLAVRRMDAAAG
jgi:molybdopterin/thiamine biosynthesis adenylyltransferase